jgi:hypothetical protein
MPQSLTYPALGRARENPWRHPGVLEGPPGQRIQGLLDVSGCQLPELDVTEPFSERLDRVPIAPWFGRTCRDVITSGAIIKDTDTITVVLNRRAYMRNGGTRSPEGASGCSWR